MFKKTIKPSSAKAVIEKVYSGSNPNLLNIDDLPLLHALVKYNEDGCNNKIIADLIQHKADINIKDSKNRTVFQRLLDGDCSYEPSVADAFYLISLGADKNTKNSQRLSFLHILIKNNWDYDPFALFFNTDLFRYSGANDKSIIALIRIFKADPNIVDNEDKTPLQHLMDNKLGYPVRISQIELLLTLGAYADTQDSKGRSLLHLFVMSGKPMKFIEKFILNFKPNLNIKNNRGETALKCLVDNPKYTLEDFVHFISLGADPNVKDSNDETLLEYLRKNYKHKKDNLISYLEKNYKGCDEENKINDHEYDGNSNSVISETLSRQVTKETDSNNSQIHSQKVTNSYLSFLERNLESSINYLKLGKDLYQELKSEVNSKIEELSNMVNKWGTDKIRRNLIDDCELEKSVSDKVCEKWQEELFPIVNAQESTDQIDKSEKEITIKETKSQPSFETTKNSPDLTFFQKKLTSNEGKNLKGETKIAELAL